MAKSFRLSSAKNVSVSTATLSAPGKIYLTAPRSTAQHTFKSWKKASVVKSVEVRGLKAAHESYSRTKQLCSKNNEGISKNTFILFQRTFVVWGRPIATPTLTARTAFSITRATARRVISEMGSIVKVGHYCPQQKWEFPLVLLRESGQLFLYL